MTLHYSLFRFDAEDYDFCGVVDLSQVSGFTIDDSGNGLIYVGAELLFTLPCPVVNAFLSALDKYKRIYHAAKMAPWIDKFALSHGAKACLRIDDYFAAVAEDFSTTIGDESYLEVAKII